MSIHERDRMSHTQHLNLMAVGLWLTAIILFTAAAWSSNGYAVLTGLLFLVGGGVAAHKADDA